MADVITPYSEQELADAGWDFCAEEVNAVDTLTVLTTSLESGDHYIDNETYYKLRDDITAGKVIAVKNSVNNFTYPASPFLDDTGVSLTVALAAVRYNNSYANRFCRLHFNPEENGQCKVETRRYRSAGYTQIT